MSVFKGTVFKGTVFKTGASGGVSLAGDAAWSWTPGGALRAEKPLAAECAAVWSAAGALSAEILLAGNCASAWTSGGALRVEKPLAGDAGWAWSSAGGLEASAALAGEATWSWAPGGALQRAVHVAGGASLSWTAGGALAEGALSGGIAWGWSAGGALEGGAPAVTPRPVLRVLASGLVVGARGLETDASLLPILTAPANEASPCSIDYSGFLRGRTITASVWAPQGTAWVQGPEGISGAMAFATLRAPGYRQRVTVRNTVTLSDGERRTVSMRVAGG